MFVPQKFQEGEKTDYGHCRLYYLGLVAVASVHNAFWYACNCYLLYLFRLNEPRYATLPNIMVCNIAILNIVLLSYLFYLWWVKLIVKNMNRTRALNFSHFNNVGGGSRANLVSLSHVKLGGIPNRTVYLLKRNIIFAFSHGKFVVMGLFDFGGTFNFRC